MSSGRRTLNVRLLVWFLLISLVPLLLVVLLFLDLADTALRRAVRDHVLAVADGKSHQLEAYARDRLRSVSALARSVEVIAAVEGGRPADDEALAAYLSAQAEAYGYTDLYLVAKDGRILLSLHHPEDIGQSLTTGRLRGSELANAVDRAATLLQIEVSDYEVRPGETSPSAFVAAPVFRVGRPVGVVLIGLAAKDVQELVSDLAGLGATGEVVAGTRVKDEILSVAPLRHDPASAFRRRFPLTGPGMSVLQKAVQGQKSYGEMVDYRGQRVLAMGRYLPSLRWGLVVKIDRSEAFELLTKQRRAVLLVGVLSVVGVLLSALGVARAITAPIQRLREGAGLVAAGKRDHVVEVAGDAEIADLTVSFNKMTAELAAAYQDIEMKVQLATTELQEAVKQLQATEGQLAHSEKMASLGQMVAGIAHEINNPTNFISGSSQMLAARIKDLETFLFELMGEEEKGSEVGAEIRKRLSDLLQTTTTIGNGAERITKIVKGLKTFSRLDEADWKPTDLEAGIDSTLDLLQFRLHEVAVVKEYGQLPLVWCQGAQINQIVMNLIVNALQTIEEKAAGREPRPAPLGTITIATSRNADRSGVVITVTDTGAGIPKENLRKIFDPFYTTKPVGTGTGLGLSISFSIAQAHKGRIEVSSEVGIGSAFKVLLPVGSSRAKAG